MLADRVGWAGSFVSTYRDEVDAWHREHDDPEYEIVSVQCTSEAMSQSFDTVVSDMGSWMSSRKVVTLYGVDAWPIADLRKYVDGLQKISMPVDLAVTAYDSNQHLTKYLEPIVELQNRWIPVEYKDRVTWAHGWLADRGVQVERADLMRLFEVCGDDVRGSVEVIVSVAGSFTGPVDRAQLLGSAVLGPVEINVLVEHVISGDCERTMQTFERTEHHGIMYIATVLLSRFRQIAASYELSDEEMLASGLVRSSGQLYYVRKEARGLDPQTCDVAIEAVSDAVRAKIYGGVSEHDACLAMLCRITDATSRRVSR